MWNADDDGGGSGGLDVDGDGGCSCRGSGWVCEGGHLPGE